MIDDKTRQFLNTNLKGLLQDTLEWMEARNAVLREGTDLGNSTPAEAKLFAVLRGRERSISEIARALGVSRQAVHHTVHRLVAAGVVELVSVPHSRREKRVCITPAGHEVQKLAAINLRRIEEEVAAHIGSEDLEQLRHSLLNLLDAVQTGESPR